MQSMTLDAFLPIRNIQHKNNFCHRYYFGKWCPGAQPYFAKILFEYRCLEVIKNMGMVLKAVPTDSLTSQTFGIPFMDLMRFCAAMRNGALGAPYP